MICSLSTQISNFRPTISMWVEEYQSPQYARRKDFRTRCARPDISHPAESDRYIFEFDVGANRKLAYTVAILVGVSVFPEIVL